MPALCRSLSLVGFRRVALFPFLHQSRVGISTASGGHAGLSGTASSLCYSLPAPVLAKDRWLLATRDCCHDPETWLVSMRSAVCVTRTPDTEDLA